MPELLEIEMYRRLADRAVGRTISRVDAPDAWYLKDVEAAEIRAEVGGERITGTRRRGKLLLLDLSSGSTLGLRFGMTGRLIVDGDAAIEKLEYASGRNDPAWIRFSLHFDDGGSLVMQDPRRLGGVLLDPDEAALGPDAWTISPAELQTALVGATALKARLLDQKRIAGLGNLLVDELLWRVGLAPDRAARSLSAEERSGLHAGLVPLLDELFDRGGSHRGDLQEHRDRDGHCPADGAPLRRATIGGRTTYWCASHQR